MELEQLKDLVDRYIGMESVLDTSNTSFGAVLHYRSPTGVLLFSIGLYKGNVEDSWGIGECSGALPDLREFFL